MNWTVAHTADVLVLIVFLVAWLLAVVLAAEHGRAASEALKGLAIGSVLLFALLLLIYAAGTFNELQEYILYQVCPVCEEAANAKGD